MSIPLPEAVKPENFISSVLHLDSESEESSPSLSSYNESSSSPNLRKNEFKNENQEMKNEFGYIPLEDAAGSYSSSNVNQIKKDYEISTIQSKTMNITQESKLISNKNSTTNLNSNMRNEQNPIHSISTNMNIVLPANEDSVPIEKLTIATLNDKGLKDQDLIAMNNNVNEAKHLELKSNDKVDIHKSSSSSLKAIMTKDVKEHNELTKTHENSYKEMRIDPLKANRPDNLELHGFKQRNKSSNEKNNNNMNLAINANVDSDFDSMANSNGTEYLNEKNDDHYSNNVLLATFDAILNQSRKESKNTIDIEDIHRDAIEIRRKNRNLSSSLKQFSDNKPENNNPKIPSNGALLAKGYSFEQLINPKTNELATSINPNQLPYQVPSQVNSNNIDNPLLIPGDINTNETVLPYESRKLEISHLKSQNFKQIKFTKQKSQGIMTSQEKISQDQDIDSRDFINFNQINPQASQYEPINDLNISNQHQLTNDKYEIQDMHLQSNLQDDKALQGRHDNALKSPHDSTLKGHHDSASQGHHGGASQSHHDNTSQGRHGSIPQVLNDFASQDHQESAFQGHNSLVSQGHPDNASQSLHVNASQGRHDKTLRDLTPSNAVQGAFAKGDDDNNGNLNSQRMIDDFKSKEMNRIISNNKEFLKNQKKMMNIDDGTSNNILPETTVSSDVKTEASKGSFIKMENRNEIKNMKKPEDYRIEKEITRENYQTSISKDSDPYMLKSLKVDEKIIPMISSGLNKPEIITKSNQLIFESMDHNNNNNNNNVNDNGDSPRAIFKTSPKETPFFKVSNKQQSFGSSIQREEEDISNKVGIFGNMDNIGGRGKEGEGGVRRGKGDGRGILNNEGLREDKGVSNDDNVVIKLDFSLENIEKLPEKNVDKALVNENRNLEKSSSFHRAYSFSAKNNQNLVNETIQSNEATQSNETTQSNMTIQTNEATQPNVSLQTNETIQSNGTKQSIEATQSKVNIQPNGAIQPNEIMQPNEVISQKRNSANEPNLSRRNAQGLNQLLLKKRIKSFESLKLAALLMKDNKEGFDYLNHKRKSLSCVIFSNDNGNEGSSSAVTKGEIASLKKPSFEIETIHRKANPLKKRNKANKEDEKNAVQEAALIVKSDVEHEVLKEEEKNGEVDIQIEKKNLDMDKEIQTKLANENIEKASDMSKLKSVPEKEVQKVQKTSKVFLDLPTIAINSKKISFSQQYSLPNLSLNNENKDENYLSVYSTKSQVNTERSIYDEEDKPISVYSHKSLKNEINVSRNRGNDDDEDNGSGQNSLSKMTSSSQKEINMQKQMLKVGNEEQKIIMNDVRLSKMDENEAAGIYEKRRYEIINNMKRISKNKLKSPSSKLPKAIIKPESQPITTTINTINTISTINTNNTNTNVISQQPKTFLSPEKTQHPLISNLLPQSATKTEKNSLPVKKSGTTINLTKNKGINTKTFVSSSKAIKSSSENGLKNQEYDVIPNTNGDGSNEYLKQNESQKQLKSRGIIQKTENFAIRTEVNIQEEEDNDSNVNDNELVIPNDEYNIGKFADTIRNKKERILRQIQKIDKQLEEEIVEGKGLMHKKALDNKQNGENKTNNDLFACTFGNPISKKSDNTESKPTQSSRIFKIDNTPNKNIRLSNKSIEINKTNPSLDQSTTKKNLPNDATLDFSKILYGSRDGSSTKKKEGIFSIHQEIIPPPPIAKTTAIETAGVVSNNNNRSNKRQGSGVGSISLNDQSKYRSSRDNKTIESIKDSPDNAKQALEVKNFFTPKSKTMMKISKSTKTGSVGDNTSKDMIMKTGVSESTIAISQFVTPKPKHKTEESSKNGLKISSQEHHLQPYYHHQHNRTDSGSKRKLENIVNQIPIWKQERLDEIPSDSNYFKTKSRISPKAEPIVEVKDLVDQIKLQMSSYSKIANARRNSYNNNASQSQSQVQPQGQIIQNINNKIEQKDNTNNQRQSSHEADKLLLSSSQKKKTLNLTMIPDEFYTRNQEWNEKKMKWRQERYREIQENQLKDCTFQPKTSSPSPPKHFDSKQFYERNIKWSEKIQHNNQIKQEETLKNLQKPISRSRSPRQTNDLGDSLSRSITSKPYHNCQMRTNSKFYSPRYQAEIDQAIDLFNNLSMLIQNKSNKIPSEYSILEKSKSNINLKDKKEPILVTLQDITKQSVHEKFSGGFVQNPKNIKSNKMNYNNSQSARDTNNKNQLHGITAFDKKSPIKKVKSPEKIIKTSNIKNVTIVNGRYVIVDNHNKVLGSATKTEDLFDLSADVSDFRNKSPEQLDIEGLINISEKVTKKFKEHFMHES